MEKEKASVLNKLNTHYAILKILINMLYLQVTLMYFLTLC